MQITCANHDRIDLQIFNLFGEEVDLTPYFHPIIPHQGINGEITIHNNRFIEKNSSSLIASGRMGNLNFHLLCLDDTKVMFVSNYLFMGRDTLAGGVIWSPYSRIVGNYMEAIWEEYADHRRENPP